VRLPLGPGPGYQGVQQGAGRAENSRIQSCNSKLTDCSEYSSVIIFVLSDSTKLILASSPARTEGNLRMSLTAIFSEKLTDTASNNLALQ